MLEHAEDILGMFKLTKDISKLETTDDSVVLGNMFVDAGLMLGFK